MHHLSSVAAACRRGTLTQLALGLCLLLSAGQARARIEDPLFENFTRSNSTKFNAIILRDQNKAYVIATPDKVYTISRLEAKPDGNSRPEETVRLDKLLNGVERWIRLGRFSPARDDMKRVKTAIEDYNKYVSKFERGSTYTDDFKKSIKNARKYYEEESEAIDPTIQALEICKRIRSLLDEIRNKKRKASRDLLLRMASMLGELEAIKHPTRLAAPERKRSGGNMQAKVNEFLEKLTKDAVANFAAAYDITSSRELMETLAKCAAARKTGFDDAQAPLIKALSEKAGAFAQELPQSARDIFKYDGKVSLDFEPHKKKLRQMRAINAALNDIREKTYGSKAKNYAAGLGKQIEANKQEMAKGDKIRDLIYAIRKDYGIALATLEKGDHMKAKAMFQALDKKLEPSGLKVADMRRNIYRLIMESDGRYVLSRMQKIDKLSRKEVLALLAEAIAFDRKYGTQFSQSEDLRKKIKLLQGYKALLDRIREIQDNIGEDAKLAWVTILEVGDQLKKDATDIHPRGKKEWQEFLDEDGEKAYKAVIKRLSKSGVDAGDARDRWITTTCMEYLLQKGKNKEAATFINELLRKLKLSHEDKFAADLIKLEMRAGEKFAEAGDVKGATAIYDAIKERHPDFDIDKLLAKMLLMQASQLEEGGEQKEALQIYTRVAKELSVHATTKTFDSILKLRYATDETMSADPPAWYGYLETFCLEFGQKVEDAQKIGEVKAEVIAKFSADWDGEDELAATEGFVNFLKTYPTVAKISGVAGEIFALTNKRLRITFRDEKKAGSQKILDSLRLMLSSDYRKEAVRNSLDEMYVTFRMRQAQRLLDIGQVGNIDRAYEIYEEIKKDFADHAQANGVDDIMLKWRWRRRLDHFCKPLAIYSVADWIALGFWILYWLWYFIRSMAKGRRYGHLRNSVWHFVTVFCSFSLLLGVLLLGGGGEGSLQHAWATAIALLVPGLVFLMLGFFNGFGLFPYVFFPLIYARRRLNMSRLALKVGRWLPGVKNRLGALERNVAELEEDLPLLHDRWLFRIARAARLAETDPEKAFGSFEKLHTKLEKELVKDEGWEEHRTNCLFNLGDLAWELKRSDEAKDYLNQHLEKDPRSLDTRELLAEIHYELKEYEEAVPHLKVCLAAQSANDALWHQLGRCFFETRKYKSAFKCFETMQQPTRDSLFYGARAFARIGMHQRSVDWFQRLLKLNANDGEAIYYLASSFAQLGEDVKAFKIIALVKADDPHYPQSLALQGSLLYRNKKFQKAEEYYKAALEYDSTLPQALLGQGQLALEADQIDDAAGHLMALVGRSPDSAPGNYYYGVVLEKQGDDRALDHFSRAITSETFKRQSATHMGRIHFFNQNYVEAIQQFETAEAAGERSPWFLYLYAYALACAGELDRCDQVVISILGHTAPDLEWQQRAAGAMYALGYKLFELEDYTTAGKCFGYVKTHCGDTAPDKLDELLEESRFRTIVSQIQKGDYAQATAVVAELQLSTQNQNRFTACQYYTALCDLYQKQYDSAHKTLTELLSKDAGNPRFQYHLAVAKLGMGAREEAEALIETVSQKPDVPKHIQVGITTVRAYCMAEDGKEREAEQILADVKETREEFTGVEYVAQRVLLTRAYYLCAIQDSARLQFLHAEMTDATRSQAAYLQALSCLEGGHLSAAINNLRPFANESRNNVRLYTTLSTELAATAVREGNAKRATEILESIPNPPAVVVSALEALRMARTLKDADTIEGLGNAVSALQQSLNMTRDPSLVHSIRKNLSILILRLAILVEDTRDKANVEEFWTNFWTFWEQNVFGNPDFWRMCHERVVAENEPAYNFTPEEAERLNGSVREDVLMKIFMGFVLGYLHETGSQTDLMRHLNYFTQMGQQDDKLTEYMKRLGREAKTYVDNIDKSDPILKTWDFVIGYMRLQVTVAEITNPDEVPSLQDQLETYLEFRNHYAAPSDYMQAKKVFNTKLLDTLQEGINGKFSVAGDRLDRVLSEIPHGVNIDPVQQALWDLRETCRKPSAALERGVNLVMEFERMYQRVVNFSLQKGN